MKNVYVDVLNKTLHEVTAELILDDKVSKLLYYNDVMDEDIYSKPSLRNPIKTLLNQKVFKRKKIKKIQTEADVGMCVSMSLYEPYTNYYKTSDTIKHLQIDIACICHDDCIDTLNGNRCLAIIEQVCKCIHQSEYIKSVGKIKLCQAFPIYDVPDDYEGYAIRLDVDIINYYKRD